MKIEIDLNQILHDEDYGSETIQDSVRRQVIEALTNDLKKSVRDKIDHGVSKLIDEQLKVAMGDITPKLVQEIVEADYTPIDDYGRRGEKTNFKNKMIDTINKQMVYKQESYSDRKNAFTKAIDDVLDKKMEIFKKEFTAILDREYVAQVKQYALKTLKERLGV